MSNAVAEAPEVATVEIDKIKLEKGFNPRGNVTKASVEDLAKSIKQEGLLQPILIRPDEDGYRLVAGHRRYTAAKVAGLTEIPALIRELDDDEAKAAAFDENEQREDMTPMARAIVLESQFKKLGSFKKVAEKRALQPQQVGTLVKMCELPEKVQKIALANMDFGPDLAKTLVDVADAPGGEDVAVFLAQQAMSSRPLYRRIRDQIPSALDEIVRYRLQAESQEELDSVPFVATINRTEPSEVFEGEKAETLTARGMAAVQPFDEYEGQRLTGLRIINNHQWSQGDPSVEITMTVESFDRMKAAKSAFIYEDEHERTTVHIFDRKVLEAEVEQIIETAEKLAKAELKEREEARQKEAEQAAAESGSNAAAGEDAIKEQRKREREKAKAAAAKARTENEEIGDGLLKRSSKPLSKKDQLETIRLLAKATVKQDDSLAGLGMRLCFTTWKEIEVKELKSGAKREKVTYLEPREAKERLIESIDNAKSVDEILRIVTNAMVTATYSNQDELPQSKRIWRTVDPIKNVGREDMEVIDRLAKGVLPENIEKKRQESVDEGYEKRQTPHYV